MTAPFSPTTPTSRTSSHGHADFHARPALGLGIMTDDEGYNSDSTIAINPPYSATDSEHDQLRELEKEEHYQREHGLWAIKQDDPFRCNNQFSHHKDLESGNSSFDHDAVLAAAAAVAAGSARSSMSNPDGRLLTPSGHKHSPRRSPGLNRPQSRSRHLNDTADATPQAAEYSVPASTKYFYLALYFGLNLSLTLFNKAVLGKFAFPWLLTTIHTTTAALGCLILLWRGHFRMTRLTNRENMTLLGFSVLYTVNIAISNVSLEMVSVSFHQIMRSTSPLFTILIYRLWYTRSYALATYISLMPIMFGAALTTYGDYYFTPLGCLLTLLGVMLAALKTVATNRLMTGNLKLHALELLFRMSPLAAVQSLVFGYCAGEVTGFLTWLNAGHLSLHTTSALAGNGLLAFLLNVASLHTNKLAGALTMSICANLKQCLTVLLGIVLFDTRITVISGYGMIVTLVGAAAYSKVELEMRAKGPQQQHASPPSILSVPPSPYSYNGDHSSRVPHSNLSPKSAGMLSVGSPLAHHNHALSKRSDDLAPPDGRDSLVCEKR